MQKTLLIGNPGADARIEAPCNPLNAIAIITPRLEKKGLQDDGAEGRDPRTGQQSL